MDCKVIARDRLDCADQSSSQHLDAHSLYTESRWYQTAIYEQIRQLRRRFGKTIETMRLSDTLSEVVVLGFLQSY